MILSFTRLLGLETCFSKYVSFFFYFVFLAKLHTQYPFAFGSMTIGSDIFPISVIKLLFNGV
jgi:hypothetical protein